MRIKKHSYLYQYNLELLNTWRYDDTHLKVIIFTLPAIANFYALVDKEMAKTGTFSCKTKSNPNKSVVSVYFWG